MTCILLFLIYTTVYAQILPHQRLGVPHDCPPAELRRAYRRKSLELHPDKHQGGKKAWAEKEFVA
eukprot:CAMPEP_0181332398 /NCGR_PEP_ID=MMETSP1101-20121128/25076_1 /TAXON_ID=46948 /ORGANISM="Rhodomonas abbreviata, Strain Caron Lab Isolate" /LENGTH=64 /DNA_ID=CAMNT_0023442047 /DNA_START=61 /DNA_END=251 /DNA_ORIENTATION=-